VITSEADLKTKIRLATQLGFADDVAYWTEELEKLKKEGSS
jgi:hypothetical protein